MLPNVLAFDSTEKEQFLEGTRLLAIPDQVCSYYFKSEFQKRSRQFLENLLRNYLSTVDARFLTGHFLSFICSENIIGRDDYSDF